MEERFAAIVRFVTTGGIIMIPLLVLGLTLWVALVLRWFELRLGWRRTMPELLRAPQLNPRLGVLPYTMQQIRQHVRRAEPRWRLRHLIADQKRILSKGRFGIDAMIAVAPLLGLLGTVSGMIETFDALGSFARAEQAERISDGISKALVTTEFGLFLSIPGLLASRALRRREARIHRQLDELEAIVAAQLDPEPVLGDDHRRDSRSGDREGPR